MRDIIKRPKKLLLFFLTILTLIVVIYMCTNFNSASAEDNEVQLDLTFDFAPEPGRGHTWLGASAPSTDLEKTMVESWKNLSIKVTDSEGNVYEVPKEYHFGRGTSYLKDGGKYKDGEKLTIEIDPSGLPDGYHISWNGNDSYHKVKYINGYYKMEYTITKANMNAKLFYIMMGKLTTKFDMMGGTSSSGDSPVVRVVNKDNSVDFPEEPTKENLHFGGWFTRSGDYQRYWTSKNSFADLNQDWWQYNDLRIDPLYDGFFVLRAKWNAHVEFDSDGGTPVDTAVVEEGHLVSCPKAPTKENAKFLYWQDENGESYDWLKPVTKDMKLKAVWQEEVKVDIKFDPNGGIWEESSNTAPMSVKTKMGQDIKMPKAPVRKGYSFKYWMGSTYAAGESYKVEPERTFTAVWEKEGESKPDPDTPSVKPGDDTTNSPIKPGDNSTNPSNPGGSNSSEATVNPDNSSVTHNKDSVKPCTPCQPGGSNYNTTGKTGNTSSAKNANVAANTNDDSNILLYFMITALATIVFGFLQRGKSNKI